MKQIINVAQILLSLVVEQSAGLLVGMMDSGTHW